MLIRNRYTSQPHFKVDWDHPEDPSEIAAAWYKIGEEPVSPEDGKRITEKPLIINNPPEGKHPVYIWLEDGIGNVDH